MDFAKRNFHPAGPLNEWERIATFFGHHDCRALISAKAWIDVGAGSLPCARFIAAHGDWVGSVGQIGRYCEFADCLIQAGVEHPNDRPVNSRFNFMMVHMSETGVQMVDPDPAKISIGSNVTISQSAIVLGGVPIGDGVVVGAGAVVTKAAEPFGIYAGVPARKMRDRFGPEQKALVQKVRWWDFDADYLVSNIGRLQELAVSDVDHPRIADRPRFLIGKLDGRMSVIGFTDGDANRPIAEAPPTVQAYVAQAMGDGPYYWLADCWADA